MENIAVTTAIRSLGMEKETQEFAQHISGLLFASRENKEFQEVMGKELTTRVKQLIAKNRDFNVYGMLFSIHNFPKPEVVNVQLVSIRVFSTFVVYSLSVDISDKDVKLDIVQGPMGASYDTDRLISTRMDLFVDTINKQEFLAVTDAGVARRVPQENTQDDARLLPQGLVAGYWPTLPNEIELLESYGTMPAGTKLILNPETETYSCELGGIPAIMYHLVFSTGLPVIPDPSAIFDSEQPLESEDDPDFGTNKDNLDDFFEELE